MSLRVSLVDFGAGNLLSVRRALSHCGAEVSLAETADAVMSADRLVLPGVGAFATCINALRQRGLFEAVLEFATSDRPFLGICVGMQMMFDASEEFGEHAGLGLIPGRVRRIVDTTPDGVQLKVPHVGWNALIESRSGGWTDGVLQDLAPGTAVYFIHSYQGEPIDVAHRLAECQYGGRRILAAVQIANLFGCQFHPEKSGPAGLRIIGNFLTL